MASPGNFLSDGDFPGAEYICRPQLSLIEKSIRVQRVSPH
jgi:hypothetical protein